MYTYPLKLEFPFISLGRQVDVNNGDGKFIMRAADPFISFKDIITMKDGNGNVVYQVNGDAGFRFFFQFTSTSFQWDIVTADNKPVAYVDDYYARMEEFQEMQVSVKSSKPVMQADGRADIGGVLGNVASSLAENMINGTIDYNMPKRLVYRIRYKETEHVLGWIVPSRGTAWFDFLPYSTRIQLLSLPFMARFYTPSYEFRLGSLSSPTVLKLQKQRDLFVDRYIVEKTGELTDAQERWVIPALTLVTIFERTRVKQMADW